MSNECNRQQGDAMQHAAPLVSNDNADYSYDQWRHAQMRQMEHDYRAVCRQEERQLVGGDNAAVRSTVQAR